MFQLPAAGQRLPQNHPYQIQLYNWLKTVSVQDVTIDHTDLAWDWTFTEEEKLTDLYLLMSGSSTWDDSPRFSIRGDARWFVLDDGNGAGIEGSGAVKMLRWANDAAFLYQVDLRIQNGAAQGNPYFQDAAVCRRALVATAVDLMMLDEEHRAGGSIRSDYLGGTLNALAYAYDTCRGIVDGTARAAFEAGFDFMMDKLLLWGPRQVNTNMDTRAVAASAYIYKASDDSAIKTKAIRVAKRFMFGSDTGSIDDVNNSQAIFMRAGYVSEARGPETTYNGVSLYHILEACTITRDYPEWQFMVEPCVRMIDFKLYQYYHDPIRSGFYDGPAGYANRTGNSYVYDQQYFLFRDIVAADFHPTEKALVRNRVWPENTNLKPIADLPEFISYDVRQWNDVYQIGNPENAPPPDWSEDHWPPNHPYMPESGWYERLKSMIDANDPRTLTPYERSASFSRLFDDEFWAYKNNDQVRDFGFFVEHIPRKWPYDSWAGGSLQTFWTEDTGIVILSMHDKSGDQLSSDEDTRVFSIIDTWGAHHVWGRDVQGFAFTNAAWNDVGAGVADTEHAEDSEPYVTFRSGFADERGWPEGVIDAQGQGIDTTKALLVSRFTATATGIQVDRTVASDGTLQVTELWDTLPIFLRSCSPPFSNSGDDGLECMLEDTRIAYWDGANYVPLQTSLIPTERIRLTRDFGSGPKHAYIVFDTPQRVKLADDVWQGSYMSHNRIRNIHIDLLGQSGAAPLPGTSIRYTISSTENLQPAAPPANQAPSVSLLSPGVGQFYQEPATIPVTALASDTDGDIVRVEFFEGQTRLGEDADGSDGWGIEWPDVPQGTYTFTAVAFDDDGASSTSLAVTIDVAEPQSTSNEDSDLPVDFALHQNYPNPFSEETTLTFDVPSAAHVELSVFDVSGRMVTHLLDAMVSPGKHRVVWKSQGVSDGIYLIRMQSDGGVYYRRVTVLN